VLTDGASGLSIEHGPELARCAWKRFRHWGGEGLTGCAGTLDLEIDLIETDSTFIITTTTTMSLKSVTFIGNRFEHVPAGPDRRPTPACHRCQAR
jgi:hypothetical protein